MAVLANFEIIIPDSSVRLSRSLFILLITLQVVACGSGSGSGQSSSGIVNLNWIAPSEREDRRLYHYQKLLVTG